MSSTTTRAMPINDALAGVPDVIRRYFELDADRAIDSIVALFTDHAQVVDESEARHGRSEIRGGRSVRRRSTPTQPRSSKARR